MKNRFQDIPSPCYVVEEEALRRNMAVVDRVRRESGAEIIVALKACAMWAIFPELALHSDGATASSLNEARLVAESWGRAHTYAPVYGDAEFDEIAALSSHITFNSTAQFERFRERAVSRGISCGLRVNPGWSPVETDLYNPAIAGSRLGIERLDALPDGVEGLHFHVLCESSADDLGRALAAFETRFGQFLPQLQWVNFGGGHLMTREGYDVGLLIETIKDFRARYPHLRVILEPGSAFTWRTGVLAATVEDIVESGGVRTAMLDVSFACHMPDCLEMPYKPAIRGAVDGKGYRMGGCSCLAGDWMGEWDFGRELAVGEMVVFEDMIHYTMVKTTMFNGVRHPSIGIVSPEGDFRLIRTFYFADFKGRMG